MILIIDTTDKICEAAIASGHNIDSVKWLWDKDTGTEVLKNIQMLLKKHQKELTDLKAILVNQGSGSFTGVRAGITVANTLAWALNIPVLGYREGMLDGALTKARQIRRSKFLKIALPYYPSGLGPPWLGETGPAETDP